jgi:hypothetical protein
LAPGVSQDRVSETARVHLVSMTADVGRAEIRISCLMRSSLENASWYTRDGQVPYEVDI